MNGKRAKLLRRIAYGNTYRTHETEYKEVRCPGQSTKNPNRTRIADHKRFMYQTLKGRRGYPAL
jgi:hypothetical protein